MKIKSAVFLVESPMQLINAIEAKHYFEIQETYLLIRYDGIASNDRHIDYVLDTIDNRFSRISRFVLQYGKKDFFKMCKPILLCLRYNPEYLFIGNYFSGYSKLAQLLYPNKKTIFLDDGAQTTKLYYDNKKINLFSYFSFNEIYPGRIYEKHSFEFLKHKLKDNKQEIKKNLLFFIGTPLVENHLIETSKYDNVLKTVVSFYSGYKIIYFPHRFEDLSKLKERTEFEIASIDMPFELYLLQLRLLPEKIVSFYSAALYTVNSMMGEMIKVEAFRIPSSYFLDVQYADKIDKLYKFLSNSIEVKDDNENL